MERKDYKKLCELSIPIVRAVGSFIRQELGKVSNEQIEIKERNSLVSYVDKEAEKQLVVGLKTVLITEEGTVEQGGASALWIIDPLDGTSNFLHNIPHFAVSVGLQIDGILRVGVVLDVMREECFYAWEGGGAFLNNAPISISSTFGVDKSIIGTGFPYDPVHVRPLMDTLEYFVTHGRGIRRMGAAALDLAYVACGRLDAYYESTLHSWDIAGGALIVKEAGGVVSDFDGGETYLDSGRIIVANAALHKEVQSILSDNFDLLGTN
jgi:myo-inositol-1(or 4)-monophosphatase